MSEQILTEQTEDARIHCQKCNSDIEPRNVMRRDWEGNVGEFCPNCATSLAPAPEPVAVAPIDRLGVFCPNCGAQLVDPIMLSPNRKPDIANFCPFCGTNLTHQSTLASTRQD